MAWRDQLQPASFRNVACDYRSTTITRGRRNVVHEYPGRNEPDVEDQGRRARRFGAELLLLASKLGDRYWSEVARLEEAVEAEGPGTLVHPQRGILQVQVDECRQSFEKSEGGLARFSLQFIEAGPAQAQPVATVNSQQALARGATDLVAAGREDFIERYATTGYSEFVRAAASRVLETARRTLGVATPYVGRINDAIGIADVLIGARAELATLGLPRLAALDGWAELLGREPEDTASRRQINRNRDALVQLTDSLLLAGSIDAVASADFDSVEEALATRDAISTRIDAATAAAPDALYTTLVQLRADLVEDIRTRSADLARLRRHVPPVTLPSLVIAHRLYGDARRADEIVARNNVAHPGFVPGGVALEVLEDA